MSRDELITNGLEAAGFPLGAHLKAKNKLIRLTRRDAKHLTEDEIDKLIGRIEKNAARALSEIKNWPDHERETGEPPPSWLRPTWEMARYQYARQTIVQWGDEVKMAQEFEDGAPRQSDMAEKLSSLSRDLLDPVLHQHVIGVFAVARPVHQPGPVPPQAPGQLVGQISNCPDRLSRHTVNGRPISPTRLIRSRPFSARSQPQWAIIQRGG